MKKEQIEPFFPDRRWSDARERFRKFYADNQILHMDGCRAFNGLISLLLASDSSLVPKVSGRVKRLEECIKKFELKYLAESEKEPGDIDIGSQISDLIGLRVVCIYESDIEEVAAILRKNLTVFSETDKTGALELHENQFGYKGLHLDARLDSARSELPEYKRFANLNFEIQVRSIVQDAWSEVDHRLKYKKRIPRNLKRRINRLAALFELADQEFEAIRDNTADLELEGEKLSGGVDKDQTLTPFNFGPCVKQFFSGDEFEPYKVDGFVDELLQQNENMLVSDLFGALEGNLDKVKEYKDYLAKPPLGHNMNSFTQIRHCLYLEKKVLYESLMRDGPRKNFDRWLEHGTVHPKEVELKKKYPT